MRTGVTDARLQGHAQQRDIVAGLSEAGATELRRRPRMIRRFIWRSHAHRGTDARLQGHAQQRDAVAGLCEAGASELLKT